MGGKSPGDEVAFSLPVMSEKSEIYNFKRNLESLSISTPVYSVCVWLSLVFLSIVTLLFIPTFQPYTAGLHHSPDEEEHYSMPRCGQ